MMLGGVDGCCYCFSLLIMLMPFVLYYYGNDSTPTSYAVIILVCMGGLMVLFVWTDC